MFHKHDFGFDAALSGTLAGHQMKNASQADLDANIFSAAGASAKPARNENG